MVTSSGCHHVLLTLKKKFFRSVLRVCKPAVIMLRLVWGIASGWRNARPKILNLSGVNHVFGSARSVGAKLQAGAMCVLTLEKKFLEPA